MGEQNLGERDNWYLINAVQIGSPQTKHELFYEKYIVCFAYVTTPNGIKYNLGRSELPAFAVHCTISIPW